MNMDAVGIVKRETIPAHLTACVFLRDRPFLPSPADLTACRRCQVVTDLAELFGLDEENVMSKLIAENQMFTKEINLKSLLQAG